MTTEDRMLKHYILKRLQYLQTLNKKNLNKAKETKGPMKATPSKKMRLNNATTDANTTSLEADKKGQ